MYVPCCSMDFAFADRLARRKEKLCTKPGLTVQSCLGRRKCRHYVWSLRQLTLEQRLGAVQMRTEQFCVDFADHPYLGELLAGAIKEQHCRRAEQLVAIQQGALFAVAVGDVEADQAVVGEARCDLRVFEDLALDDLAADAPVGVPVEQQRLVRSRCGSQLCLEFGGSGNGLPALHLDVAASGAERGAWQWTQRVGSALQCADPGCQRVHQQYQAQQLGQLLPWRLAV